MRKQMEEGLQKWGISLPNDHALEQMEQFIEELLEKNKVMNLTAITEPREVVPRHLLDSAALVPLLQEALLCYDKQKNEDSPKLIDVGTGAGFPGIPLKILLPEVEIVLMDALEKRLLWLEAVAESLNLEDIFTVHGRGEELGHDSQYREQFDFATARAVAEMRVLAEITLPFVKVGGTFFAMKSKGTLEEQKEAEPVIARLGGEITKVHEYRIPNTDIEQCIVVVEKRRETPPEFPRRWAKMKKSAIV